MLQVVVKREERGSFSLSFVFRTVCSLVTDKSIETGGFCFWFRDNLSAKGYNTSKSRSDYYF